MQVILQRQATAQTALVVGIPIQGHRVLLVVGLRVNSLQACTLVDLIAMLLTEEQLIQRINYHQVCTQGKYHKQRRTRVRSERGGDHSHQCVTTTSLTVRPHIDRIMSKMASAMVVGKDKKYAEGRIRLFVINLP